MSGGALPPYIPGDATLSFGVVTKNLKIFNNLTVEGDILFSSTSTLVVAGSVTEAGLAVTGNVLFTSSSTLTVAGPATFQNVTASGLTVQGPINISASASGLRISEAGSGPKQGTVTLIKGASEASVATTNSSVTANSRIFLTSQSLNGTT